MSAVAELLRAEGRFAAGGTRVPWRGLALLVVAGGFSYGCVMGSFGLRPEQAAYSGVKVPLLLGISTLVCLPNFFVVNTLLGLRDDFAAACRGILVAQASVAVVLAALAPLVVVLYASSANYRLAIVGNGLLFALATFGGQVALDKHYRALVAKNRAHALARRAWAILYVFVAIQLAWVLRPFVGAPGLSASFLREDPWSNAYVEVWNDVVELLRGVLGL